jgi:WD40 repeat protein
VGVLEVFDAEGQAVGALDTRKSEVIKGLLAFTGPDGPRIVLGFEDGSVHIWDGDTFTKLPNLTSHVGPLGAMCLLADASGDMGLVTGGYDGVVKIFSPRFEVVRTLPSFGKRVTALASYTDPTSLAPRLLVGIPANTQSAGVRVYDPVSGEELHAVIVHDRPPHVFGCGPGGHHSFVEMEDSDADVNSISVLECPGAEGPQVLAASLTRHTAPRVFDPETGSSPGSMYMAIDGHESVSAPVLFRSPAGEVLVVFVARGNEVHVSFSLIHPGGGHWITRSPCGWGWRAECEAVVSYKSALARAG